VLSHAIDMINSVIMIFSNVTIAAILLVVLFDKITGVIRVRRFMASVNPHPAERSNKRLNAHRSMLSRTWVVGFFIIASIIYVLPEVLLPGELTKWSVYNICIGIGLFFYILLQSSISQLTEVVLEIEKAKAVFLARSIEGQ
jgi:hypothetical protein